MKKNFKYVLFYAVNGLGLGHVTRLLSIARKLILLDDDIEPVFLTSSEACQVIHQHGFMYYHLPSKNIIKDNKGELDKLALTYNAAINNLIAVYQPVAMVIDTLVSGSLDDLLQILLLKKNKIKKVFIHREQQEKVMTPAKIAMQNYYDLILTPHYEGTANIPVPDESKLRWCGNIMIRDRNEALPEDEIKTRFKLPKDKTILYLNMGGGGDVSTGKNYEQLFATLCKREDLHVVVSQSPLSKQLPDTRLNGNSSLISWYPMAELMSAFDIAISATGYNTFHELLYHGIPSIFIPKSRGMDDQYARAMSAGNARAGLYLSEYDIEIKLNSHVDFLLENYAAIQKNAQTMVPENGAMLAAEEIKKLIK